MAREGSLGPPGADEYSAIDRELARLLSVEPAPDFMQRVRVHVHDGAAERGTSRLRPWMPALAAAAIALAVAGALIVRPESPARPPAIASTNQAPAAGAPAGPVADGVPIGRQTTAAISRPARPAATDRAPEAEVIVPGDRRLALDRFLKMADSGAVGRELFRADATKIVEGTTEGPVAPIAIDGLPLPLPLQVDEIAGGSRGESIERR